MLREGLKLKSIEIRGFKSISYEKPVSLELGDVNILIGANGSGKSNILSFFEMVAFMMKGTLQRYVATNGTSHFFLHNGNDRTSSISATLGFSDGLSEEQYRFTLKNIPPHNLLIASEELYTTSLSLQDDINKINKPFSKQLDFNKCESTLSSGHKLVARLI